MNKNKSMITFYMPKTWRMAWWMPLLFPVFWVWVIWANIWSLLFQLIWLLLKGLWFVLIVVPSRAISQTRANRRAMSLAKARERLRNL